jgi:hypothetical protein
MEAVLAMRNIMLNIAGGYDVMAKAMSIAGVAMAVYRRRFLKPNTIAIVPEKGYERHDRASDIAIKLLEWRAKQWGVEIQHAGNGREKQLQIAGSKYKVDGFIAEQNRAIEFLGKFLNHGLSTNIKNNKQITRVFLCTHAPAAGGGGRGYWIGSGKLRHPMSSRKWNILT